MPVHPEIQHAINLYFTTRQAQCTIGSMGEIGGETTVFQLAYINQRDDVACEAVKLVGWVAVKFQ